MMKRNMKIKQIEVIKQMIWN